MFVREIVDQMCAVVMERAGLIGEGLFGGGVGDSGGGGVRGMLRRSGKLIRRVGGVSGRSGRRKAGNLATDSASRECIIQLHKDVARLQNNTWQVGRGREGRAVVEGGMDRREEV